MAAGAAGLSLSLPIGLAIAFLLVIVAVSYSQTIIGYPSGGGSYIVARKNLGKFPGLVAASALIIDYLLNAAVSLTAGVAAIASAFPAGALRVTFCLSGCSSSPYQPAWIAEARHRQVVPVYFVLVVPCQDALGLLTTARLPPGARAQTAQLPRSADYPGNPAAFSAGCTALTGIEAISNGVPAFRPPEARNARRTLLWMALLMVVLFTGTIGLTQYFAVVAANNETILSALARRLFGSGFLYVTIQTSTLLILTVAANTSFAGFPRLAAILRRELPDPPDEDVGDRLVIAMAFLCSPLQAAF